MCKFQTIMKNKRYMATKKNEERGYIPELKDNRKKNIMIKCGKCEECRKAKGSEWSIRIQEEIKNSDIKGYFVTLTFSEESLKELKKDFISTRGKEKDSVGLKRYSKREILEMAEDANNIATLAVKRFRERWIKKYGKTIKHWLVTELGHKGTERIHLHGILWQNEKEVIATNKRIGRERSNDEFSKMWKYGWVFTGHKCDTETAGYITKYITKPDYDHIEFTGKILTSPGIGKGYLREEIVRWHREERIPGERNNYRTNQNVKVKLPTYLRNKIWNEEERDRQWTEILNTGVVVINGSEIDITTNEGREVYKEAIKFKASRPSRYGKENEMAQKWEKRWKKKIMEYIETMDEENVTSDSLLITKHWEEWDTGNWSCFRHMSTDQYREETEFWEGR